MKEIYTLLEKYVISINECDIELAKTLWDTEGSVSYIHPKGHEFTFEDIKNNFYQQILNANFSKREFKISNIATKYYGNTAFLEFDWDFYGISKISEKQEHTKGKETQFIVLRDKGWKFSSVHKSN